MIHLPLSNDEAARAAYWEPVLALPDRPGLLSTEAASWRWRLAGRVVPTYEVKSWCLCGVLIDEQPEESLAFDLDTPRAYDLAERELRRWESRRNLVGAFGVVVVAWERRCLLGRSSPWRQPAELRRRAFRPVATDEATFRQERLGTWPNREKE